MRPAARDQALHAVRQFHAEHGRLPRQQEWEHATPDRPCPRTIERRWGWRKDSRNQGLDSIRDFKGWPTPE
jgi:hypothetical protein